MTTIVAGRRLHMPSSAAVGLLAGLVVTLLAGFVPLSIAARQLTLNDAWAASTMVIVIACAGVGVVVAGHQPHNLIGWLLLGDAACLGLSIDSGSLCGGRLPSPARNAAAGPAALLFSPRMGRGRGGDRALWSCSSRTANWHRGAGGGWCAPSCCRRCRLSEHLCGDGPRHRRAQYPHHAQRRPLCASTTLRECRLAALGRGGDPAASGRVRAWPSSAGWCPSWRNAGGERRQQLKWLMSGTVGLRRLPAASRSCPDSQP